jgi:hypothetical protein
LLILEGQKHYIVAVIVLVVGTVLFIYGSRYLFKRTSPSFAKSIQYQYALQNTSGHALKAVRFYAVAPIKQTSFQWCQDIQASHPYEIQTDDYGHQYLRFTFDILPLYATKIVTLQAKLMLSSYKLKDKKLNLRSYLTSEQYIESNHSFILKTAQNLKANKPIKTAENIFNWVAANITYAGYTKNARGALYAHQYKKGDCTEYMHLFIALCRANQIPARGIAGYVVTTNRKVKPGEYHNWAEFFDGRRWQIADPQKKNFMKDEQNYIAMRILHTTPNAPIEPFKRFKVEGKGVKAKMI